MPRGKNNMENFFTLFDLIGVLARRRYQTAEQYFAGLGLNHTEARLLRLLSQEGGEATQDALSNRLFVDRSNAGRGLKSLEKQGYIDRVKDEGDKRKYYVRITDKGNEAVTEITEIGKEIAQNFFGDLTADEAGMIVALLVEKVLPNED